MVKTDPVYQERKNMRYVSVLEKLRSNGLSRHYGDFRRCVYGCLGACTIDASCLHAPRV